jgi:hypothetical protein
MSDKAVNFIITDYGKYKIINFKMIRDVIKRADVEEFLNDYLKLITDYKASNIKFYGLWDVKITAVIPPTLIKLITDFMPQIREIGAETTLGTAIVFKSGTIRTLLNNYIAQYNFNAEFIKFVKTSEEGVEFIKILSAKQI